MMMRAATPLTILFFRYYTAATLFAMPLRCRRLLFTPLLRHYAIDAAAAYISFIGEPAITLP